MNVICDDIESLSYYRIFHSKKNVLIQADDPVNLPLILAVIQFLIIWKFPSHPPVRLAVEGP